MSGPTSGLILLKLVWRMSLPRPNFASRYLGILLICLLFNSCSGSADEDSKRAGQKQARTETGNTRSNRNLPEIAGTRTEPRTDIEVMEEKSILFNGRLKRYFSLIQFKAVLGEPDSSKLLGEVEPCTNIFQEADGSIDPQTRYLFKNGSRFENAQDRVAVDQINFMYGDYLVFNDITLNRHTTLAELKRLFPQAGKRVGLMEVAGSGKLQVMQLREDENNQSDGHINIFFKQGKLYSLQWWFPC
ncbi:hypothetical protein C7T94_14085 [Pedobacter yulinensis]|uniref:Uncharacterized protein n=2 Tax=Pedobacter yulinensis TaxID=2126353 RepID=A0A2T3HMK0_9SPHI|nr:hypothetical protein C7T94_14085 [Pedobacter yulinensis]